MSGPRVGLKAIAGVSGERAQRRGTALRRVMAELAPERRALLVATVLIIGVALAQAVGPWLVGRAIDRNIARHDLHGLALTMAGLLVVYVAGAVAQRGQTFIIGRTGQRTLARLRLRLFDRLLRLPLTYFATHRVGDLMSRVLNDIDTLNQLLSGGLTQLFGSVLSLLGVLIAMFVLNARLACVTITIIPLMIATTAGFAHGVRRAFRATRDTVGDVTADLEEEIMGVRDAQAFARTAANIERFRTQNAANRDANVQAVAISSAFAPAIDLLSTIGSAIVLGYGGILVFHGAVTVGVVTSFLLYVQQFFRPIQLASSVYTQAQSALAGAERIYGLLDERPEPADPPGTPALQTVVGRLDFDTVSFGYAAGHPVLHDVTFTALPGQTVAIVGPTGAGKTTIANLIPRFYDVDAGTVCIDGHDIRTVARHSIREYIAIVPQESFLFGGTIAENIAYGRRGATRTDVEGAARTVNAHDFIVALPHGYDTILGEAGGTLSQGQRQLLAFARAVIANPRILILDEATSHIDSRTEAVIQQALTTLLAGRTSIVIAHRLNTVRLADLILVIQDGTIVERGTHDTLLRLNGLYADLYARQATAPDVTI